MTLAPFAPPGPQLLAAPAACCLTHQNDARQLARVVAAAVLPGTVLEIGSGSGAVAIRLLHLRADLRVVGVEVSSTAAGESLRRATAMGLGDRLHVIRGDALVVRLPAAPSLVANPPMLPTERWFEAPAKSPQREGFAAALARRFGALESTADIWIHLFDFHGIDRSYGWGTPIAQVAAELGFELSLPHHGWRAIGPTSRVRDALPQLARLFPEADAQVDGAPARLGELGHVDARPLLIPHSVVRLHRATAANGVLR